MNDSSPPNCRRVAVVAVHGVADQIEGGSAKAVADMLLSRPAYRGQCFERMEIDVPVGPMPILPLRLAPRPARSTASAPRAKKVAAAATSSPGDSNPVERAARATAAGLDTVFGQRSRVVEAEAKGEIGPDEPSFDLQRMEEQVAEYVPDGKDAFYETVRWRGVREEGGECTEVHVYELYWADLSRFAGSPLRSVLEFFQLCFGLMLVGRHSVDAARACEGGTRWDWVRFWHRLAELMLAQVVPVLNLCLVAIGLVVCLHAVIEPPALVAATGAALGGLAALLVLARAWRGRNALTGEDWFSQGLLALLLLGLGLAAGLGLPPQVALAVAPWALPVLAWLVWGVGLVAVLGLGRWLARTQDGAMAIAICAALGTAGLLAHQAFTRRIFNWPTLVDVTLHSAEILYSCIELSWILAALAITGLSVAGLRLRRRDDRIAGRTEWTASLSVAVPYFVILVLNTALWQVLLHLIPDRLLENVAYTSAALPSASDPAHNVALWAVQRLADQAASLLVPSLVLLGFGVAVMIWMLAPSVLSEITLRSGGSEEMKADQVSQTYAQKTATAFGALRGAGEAMRCFIPLVLLLGALDILFFENAMAAGFAQSANPARVLLGLGLTAFIAGASYFRELASPVRAVIDVALDVLNWLRLRPKEHNPTARISARFTALLRLLAKGRYDTVVIIAHSQGSVISSDVLRYLRVASQGNPACEPELARLFAGTAARARRAARNGGEQVGDGGAKEREGHGGAGTCHAENVTSLRLFTMGSPLRQLYWRRFPHIYAWVADSKSNGPDRSALGVDWWSNYYRSGDYVGRHLWESAAPDDSIWRPGLTRTDGPAATKEMCLGGGAHLHYWDDTAPEVAEELDRLVRERDAGGDSGG